MNLYKVYKILGDYEIVLSNTDILLEINHLKSVNRIVYAEIV